MTPPAGSCSTVTNQRSVGSTLAAGSGRVDTPASVPAHSVLEAADGTAVRSLFVHRSILSAKRRDDNHEIAIVKLTDANSAINGSARSADACIGASTGSSGFPNRAWRLGIGDASAMWQPQPP